MWKEKALEKFVNEKLKLTPQRLKLIEVIDRIKDKHPTISEILDEIRKDFPTVSFSTLYTNLQTMQDLGLVEVIYIDKEGRIEVNLKKHINVMEGEEIIDVEDPEIIEKIEEKLGAKVKFVNVILDK